MNPLNPDEVDAQDIRRLVQGHDTDLTQLMERHAGKLFHSLFRCLQNEDDAADVAQEAFVREASATPFCKTARRPPRMSRL